MFSINDLTCRVCLQERQVLISVFEKLEDMQTTLCNLLKTCGDLQIENNDEYPKYLCEECAGELLIAAKFRDKCAKSLIALQQLKNEKQKEIEVKNCNDFFDIIEYCEEENTVEENESNHVDIANDVGVMYTLYEEIPSGEKLDSGISEIIMAPFEKVPSEESENKTEATKHSPDSEISENDEEQMDDEVETTPTKKENKKSFKCDICGAAFVQAINLQKHLLKIHTVVQCFVCRICDHWFTLETEYTKHQEVCSSVSQGNKKKGHNTKDAMENNHNKCSYCDRDFQNAFAMRMHLRTHTGERPYPCDLCDKAFKTRSSLNVHIKRHTGQADFACSVCNKTFYEQGNLDVHMRSHTGERPHSCTVCQKAFSRVFLLELHMRIHTGEKPFTCTYCDRSFRQRTDWKYHLTTHTGIKQHKCTMCSKGYVKRGLLFQHMQSQHGIQIDAVEVEAEAAANKGDIINNIDYIIETEDSG